MDQEHVLVDEVAFPQRLDQLSAAQDPEVLARLLLEPGHGIRRIALQERRVHPRKRLLKRGGRDVLLAVVEHLGIGVVLSVGPDGGEVLVGAPPEQQRPAPGHPLSHLAAHDLVVARRRPAAVLEAAAGVLVGAGRRLHHAVERQVVGHNDSAHLRLLLLVLVIGAGTGRYSTTRLDCLVLCPKNRS